MVPFHSFGEVFNDFSQLTFISELTAVPTSPSEPLHCSTPSKCRSRVTMPPSDLNPGIFTPSSISPVKMPIVNPIFPPPLCCSSPNRPSPATNPSLRPTTCCPSPIRDSSTLLQTSSLFVRAAGRRLFAALEDANQTLSNSLIPVNVTTSKAEVGLITFILETECSVQSADQSSFTRWDTSLDLTSLPSRLIDATSRSRRARNLFSLYPTAARYPTDTAQTADCPLLPSTPSDLPASSWCSVDLHLKYPHLFGSLPEGVNLKNLVQQPAQQLCQPSSKKTRSFLSTLLLALKRGRAPKSRKRSAE